MFAVCVARLDRVGFILPVVVVAVHNPLPCFTSSAADLWPHACLALLLCVAGMLFKRRCRGHRLARVLVVVLGCPISHLGLWLWVSENTPDAGLCLRPRRRSSRSIIATLLHPHKHMVYALGPCCVVMGNNKRSRRHACLSCPIYAQPFGHRDPHQLGSNQTSTLPPPLLSHPKTTLTD